MADHFDHFTRGDLAGRQILALLAGILWTLAIASFSFGAVVHGIAPAVFAIAVTVFAVRLDYWAPLSRFLRSRMVDRD